MLLGWASVEVVAITTTADPDGRRAGYAARMLELLGRKDIPLAVGVGVSRTTGREMGGLPDHDRFWGDEPAPPSGWRTSYDAMELLEASIEGGATIVAVGPCSNLAVLKEARPGRLADASIVVMGGWLDPLGDEFPTWGPRRDWNVICDVESAALVADRAGEITWCPIPGAIKAQLRERDLDRLRQCPAGRSAAGAPVARPWRRQRAAAAGLAAQWAPRRPGELPLGSGRLYHSAGVGGGHDVRCSGVRRSRRRLDAARSVGRRAPGQGAPGCRRRCLHRALAHLCRGSPTPRRPTLTEHPPSVEFGRSASEFDPAAVFGRTGSGVRGQGSGVRWWGGSRGRGRGR